MAVTRDGDGEWLPIAWLQVATQTMEEQHRKNPQKRAGEGSTFH
jgi:hypothetical protein